MKMRFLSDKPVLRVQLYVSPDFGEAQSDLVAIEKGRGIGNADFSPDFFT